MKCKECGCKIDITLDNIMIFEFETFYICENCKTCYPEEEIIKYLERVYWGGKR